MLLTSFVVSVWIAKKQKLWMEIVNCPVDNRNLSQGKTQLIENTFIKQQKTKNIRKTWTKNEHTISDIKKIISRLKLRNAYLEE